MSNLKKIYIYLVFISSILSSIYADEELEVTLSTKNSLAPLYLSKVFNEKADLEDTYLAKLFSVLKFDLNYNGFTNVIPSEYQKDFKISHFDFEVAFDSAFWQKQKIAYLIKSEVSKKTLKAYIYNVNTNLLKILSIDLVGNINEDRQKIHVLCDNIQEMLFFVKGIASSKIIYTVRSKIIYTVRSKNEDGKKLKWQSEIWSCDSDGENAKRLTHQHSYFVHPIFLPKSNNKQYLYISYKNGQPKIYLSSTFNENDNAALVNLRGNQLLPSISLNGEKLAFISDAAGNPDLFLQYFDENTKAIGKPIQLISYPRATTASPCFSPDSEKLAFVSDKDGPVRIYVINIPESHYDRKRPIAHLITKKNRENVTPSWSKDGKKLAYSAKVNNIRQIWIYDFETDQEWQLTNGAKNKENPIWANDSIHLVYNTEDNDESELYLTNINQKQSVKITKNEGRKRFPSFEP
ncbi:MAG: Protein TolB [Candidatus Anoxychlamydiales bacterium]|nr:Protein TolB [Candidatus Anoxychlamydiales bacterium]